MAKFTVRSLMAERDVLKQETEVAKSVIEANKYKLAKLNELIALYGTDEEKAPNPHRKEIQCVVEDCPRILTMQGASRHLKAHGLMGDSLQVAMDKMRSQ